MGHRRRIHPPEEEHPEHRAPELSRKGAVPGSSLACNGSGLPWVAGAGFGHPWVIVGRFWPGMVGKRRNRRLLPPPCTSLVGHLRITPQLCLPSFTVGGVERGWKGHAGQARGRSTPGMLQASALTLLTGAAPPLPPLLASRDTWRGGSAVTPPGEVGEAVPERRGEDKRPRRRLRGEAVRRQARATARRTAAAA